ncbi:MAG: hypothetical protein LBP39_01075, partial [Rickettsiales bacterium]|nr:hypothetical protein [Rickettsiales bacterium]
KAFSDGGAIYSRGDVGVDKNTLEFRGKTTFADNENVLGNGGAIYAEYSDLTFNGEVKFKKNKSNTDGGAIYSKGGAHSRNILIFNGETTFNSNESVDGNGGAMYAAEYSDLIFGGETKFEKNKSKKDGGAIYSRGSAAAENKNILTFAGRITLTGNESTDGFGGAIYAFGSDLTFGGEARFENNRSKNAGGAIYSFGDEENKNTIRFNDRTIFSGNESTRGHGGAICAERSDLIFSEDVEFNDNSSYGGGAIMLESSDAGSTVIFEKTAIFSDNSSKNNGGAIQSLGNAQNKNTLEFRAETIFFNNKSTNGHGGAIYAWYSDLVFSKDVEFNNNSSSGEGGAISLNNNRQEYAANATFSKLIAFENNSSKIGGAMHLYGNVNLTFDLGLKLINNITKNKDSGAIYMEGIDISRKTIVTVVHKNPDKPTKFKGNKSNGGEGHNAFFLQKHAELNFTVETGSINLYDVIAGGKRNEYTNVGTVVVTINSGEGWFNVREKGSIDNVKLANKGNLNLASTEPSELKLERFTNSGTVRFAIFADGRNDKITADAITLNEGTILEIVAARGTYEKEKTYDILVSESAIVGTIKNINLVLLGDSSILEIQGEFADDNRVYRIAVGQDATVENDPDDLVAPAEEIEEAKERNMNIIDNFRTVYRLSGEAEERNIPNDAKTLAEFISDVVTLTLLDNNFRPVVHAREGIYLESSYRSSKLATLENDGGMAVALGFGKSFRALNFGIYLNINTTSLSEKERRENKADILAGTLAMVGETTVLKNTLPLNLLFNLAYSRNSYTLNRNIEELDNKNISSKFSSNVFSIAVDLEKKFSLNNIITLNPFLGLHSSLLTMSPFQENGEDSLALHLETQQLTSVNLGLGISANLPHRLTPHLSIAGLFPVSASTPEMTASLKGYPDSKFTARNTSYRNPSLSLNLGLEYKLSVKLLLSTNLNYIANSSYKSFDLGLGLGMKI